MSEKNESIVVLAYTDTYTPSAIYVNGKLYFEDES